MPPASAGLTEYAKAGEAIAILGMESQKLLSRLNMSLPKRHAQRQMTSRASIVSKWNLEAMFTIGRPIYCVPHLPRLGTGHSSRLLKDTIFILQRREGDMIADGRSCCSQPLCLYS